MNILEKIQKDFHKFPNELQVNILWRYVDYVTDFPDLHEEGNYPVTFWEWYQNDYPEEEAERNGENE